MKSLCLIVLLAAVSATAQEIVQIPEDGSVTAMDRGATMSCSYNKTDPATNERLPVTWSFVDGDEVTELDEELYTVSEDGKSTLTLKENYEQGTYRCSVDGQSADFQVKYYFKLKRWEMSYNVIQGEDLKLFCTLKEGSDSEGDLTFAWYTKPESAEDPKSDEGRTQLFSSEPNSDAVEPHIKIFNRTEDKTSVLKIEDAVYADRGFFQCEVTNQRGKKASAQTMVRVKDKYAALYPFAGILAEVLVLCLIIFICERRRTSKEAREAAEEEDAEEEFNGTAGNSNVRHRRT